jgi:hypothetical protein
MAIAIADENATAPTLFNAPDSAFAARDIVDPINGGFFVPLGYRE